MTTFSEAKFVTFDCYGTLTSFQMGRSTKEIYGDRLPSDPEPFLEAFSKNRYDEVLGDWKPYPQIIRNSFRRTTDAFGLPYDEAAADAIYESIGTWGPHADVPAGLAKVAAKIPLVILSNAANDQIPSNVAQLGAPFAHVLTAESARAYKPRYRAFEYMFDQLGVAPEEIVHVSSSIRYDIMPADDLGVVNKVYVNRGYEPNSPGFNYTEIPSIAELPALFGIE